MRSSMLGLAVALVLGSACGAKVTVDGSSTGSTGGGAGSGGSGGASCGNDGLPIPPAFKSCVNDSDCSVGMRYLDCCGSQAAYGVAAARLSAFDAFEKTCNPVVPACGCVGQPTIAEDGQTTQVGMIAALCKAGACTSFVQ